MIRAEDAFEGHERSVSDERALLVGPALVVYLTEQFNSKPHWDQITRDFVTATGSPVEKGNTAIIMAQMADPSDTLHQVKPDQRGTLSRSFLAELTTLW